MLHQLFQYEKEKFAELGGVKNVIFIDDTFNIIPTLQRHLSPVSQYEQEFDRTGIPTGHGALR